MRLTTLLAWLSAAGLGLALGCDGGDTGTSPATPSPPAPSEPAPAPTPPPTPATPPEPAPVDTAAAGSGDAAAGKPHYALYCATCHGDAGCGDGPLSATLDPKPAKHCDGGYMNALSDAHLYKVIADGGPAVGKSPQMAAWGGALDEAQIWDVVAFVRSLADPPYQAP